MKIQLWTIEKTGKNDFQEAISDYEKRIKRYGAFEFKTIDNNKIASSKISQEELKKKEWQLVEKALGSNDFLVLLDERGKELRSVQIAEQFNQWQIANKGSVILLIAGAFGPSEELRKRANFTLSISKLTLPHRIAKLLLTEQIYRAFSILNGEKYHHD
jgi:23S rRNA (pseudouridine1915-N3)-methyltransferase